MFGGGGMGWDQIADALGGAFIGILTGIVLAIVLIQRLPVRHQVLVAIAAVVLSVGVVILLRVLPKPQVTHLENDIRSDVAFVPQAAVTCFRSPSCEMNMRRVWSDQ